MHLEEVFNDYDTDKSGSIEVCVQNERFLVNPLRQPFQTSNWFLSNDYASSWLYSHEKSLKNNVADILS